jgi:hypothetical protein
MVMQINQKLADLEIRLWANADNGEVARAVARDLALIDKLIEQKTPPL